MVGRTFAAIAAAFAFTALSAPAGATELVVNGGFETGDFSGWTQGGNTANTSVVAVAAHDGDFGAALGPVGDPGTLSQMIDTVVGGTYIVSFWLRNVGARQDSFTAFFDSLPVLLHLESDGAFQYQQFVYTKTANNSPSLLGFRFEDTPGYWLLDDVSVQAVPEPGTWAMMILGFGLVGGVMRRRDVRIAVAGA